MREGATPGFRFTAEIFRRRIESWLPLEVVSPQNAVASMHCDWSDLVQIADDEEFVREAYRRILNRECDVAGFIHHRELLRSGVPRRAILLGMLSSEEARRLGWRPDAFTLLSQRVRTIRWSLGRLTRVLPARLLTRARERYETVWLRPLRLMGAKLDYALQAAERRNAELSAKLDAYVAALRDQQASVARLLADVEQRLTGTEQRLASVESLLAGRLGGLPDVITGALRPDLGRLREMLQHLYEAQTNAHQRFSSLLDTSQEMIEAIRNVFAGQAEIENELQQIRSGQESLMVSLRDALAVAERERHHPVLVATGSLLVTSAQGFILAVPKDEWRIAAYLAFRGPLEPGVSKLFCRLVKPGMVVVDVGAHFGWYTLLAAQALQGRGKVYSFEPSPETFGLLRANVQVNGFLETGLIKLVPMAVADAVGRRVFGLCPGDSGQNSLFPEPAWPRVMVETTTLDQALAGEPSVDIVKIDAEGSEPLVLRGMRGTLARNPGVKILMEFAPQHLRRAGVEPDAFLDEVHRMGLKIYRVNQWTGDLDVPEPRCLREAFTAMLLLVPQREGGDGHG